MSNTTQNIVKKQPAQKFQPVKLPYAIKVLEDALRKNEEELKLWKKHVRVFSWMQAKKLAESSLRKNSKDYTLKVIIAYQDGFGNESTSKAISFQTSDEYCSNSLEHCKNHFMESITNIQAEGNIGPCEERIKQIKEALEKV